MDTDYFGGVNLAEFDVMVMPSGYYGDTFDEDGLNRIKSWVRDGGTLIALQGANGVLAGKDGFALKEKETAESEEEVEQTEQEKLEIYRQRQRESATDFNPGSIFKVTLDNTHPLAFGYGDEYFTLKLDTDAYAYLDNGWNVGVTKENAHQSGFIGFEAKEELANTLTFGVQNMGSGSVVYMVDNPLFRAFWYNGKLLFGNAVFMVGN